MSQDCPMCEELHKEEHVLKRWDNFAAIFNRFPYSIGHIMIIPIQHVSTLNDICPEQRAEFIEVINVSQQLVMKALGTDSSNIGLNHGPQSGASIPKHLHMHIIPRHPNDMGFYNTICKQIPGHQKKYNEIIRQLFASL